MLKSQDCTFGKTIKWKPMKFNTPGPGAYECKTYLNTGLNDYT